MIIRIIVLLISSCLFSPAKADPPENIRDLKLKDWDPRSMMVTKTTIV